MMLDQHVGLIFLGLKSRKCDNEKCMQEYLYSHFESEGENNFLEDMSITLINTTNGSDAIKEKLFEWVHLKHYYLTDLMLKKFK